MTAKPINRSRDDRVVTTFSYAEDLETISYSPPAAGIGGESLALAKDGAAIKQIVRNTGHSRAIEAMYSYRFHIGLTCQEFGLDSRDDGEWIWPITGKGPVVLKAAA